MAQATMTLAAQVASAVNTTSRSGRDSAGLAMPRHCDDAEPARYASSEAGGHGAKKAAYPTVMPAAADARGPMMG
jgi:hypothetical protein